VLNGEHRGKVVNLDESLQVPLFAFEDNFLDWYERWLDEVISGDLVQKKNAWFGFVRGGTDWKLLQTFQAADDEQLRIECLQGIDNKLLISNEVYNALQQEWTGSSAGIKRHLLNVYTKFNYMKARPYLEEFCPENPGAVFRTVYFYKKEKSREWIPLIRKVAGQVQDAEDFRFMGYLLVASGEDCADILVPFFKHPDDDIRTSAFYTLGQMPGKERYIDFFIEALYDPSDRVVLHVIQALDKKKDYRLLPAFQHVARSFPPESYPISNLSNHLEPFKLDVETLLELDVDKFIEKRTKWDRFWKR